MTEENKEEIIFTEEQIKELEYNREVSKIYDIYNERYQLDVILSALIELSENKALIEMYNNIKEIRDNAKNKVIENTDILQDNK